MNKVAIAAGALAAGVAATVALWLAGAGRGGATTGPGDAGVGPQGGTTGPLDVVVRPRRATLLGKDTGRPLDDLALNAIRGRPEAVEVMPRLDLAGPALGVVDLGGEDVRFEVGGFTDGIPAALIDDEPAVTARFVEPDPALPPGPACRPEDGVRACADPAATYCDPRELRCRPRVPVLVSPTMVELYDHSFAPDRHLPPAAQLLGGPHPPIFTIELGDSMVAPAAGRRHLIGAVVVGVSPHARSIGMTVPLGVVMDWNLELAGVAAATRYTAIDVHLRGGRAAFTAAMDALGLDVD